MEEALAYREERRKIKEVTLNQAKRIQEKDDADAFWLSLENSKRKSQGLPAVASLDDLNKKPTKPSVAATGGTTTPDEKTDSNSDSNTDNNTADESLKGNEMAGVIDNPMTETGDDASAQETGDTDEDKPDAYLIETGHILLDLIASEKRTADQQATHSGQTL
jgi:hypothetical protein